MEESVIMELEKSKQNITKNPQLKQAFGKAKLFEIRRLVRSIKRLSAKKGTTQQLEKNKRKVSRLEKQLEILKDLHVDTFVKAASAKAHGDELNSSDLMSADDEEDVATKIIVLEKIISTVGLDNIKDLAATVKRKDTKVKSSKEKRTKTSSTISSTIRTNLLFEDDKELDIFIAEKKEDKELDDFFSDPVVSDCNPVDFNESRAHKRRKIQVEDESDDITSKAFDSVFVGNLKSGKGKKKVQKNKKGFKDKEKNRLGQRQRRKQWEKLYGNKALHLKNEKKTLEKSSDVDEKKRRSKVPQDKKKQKFEPKTSSALHPSWEASKSKRKQESIVEFKGQKITFED
ncbi:protein bud22-like [Actinia tenebrosa]|uniref:Serum response factor-binding protein 1 n=1 Tax=Actinia tenebrosa TaxID=6105 RepID=A0A6P8HN06_ACTTE|nr:protein bud22-like [Actinia tenebrosa]